MNDKIMELIQIAMQFKDNKTASVEFGSHINGITVCVSENGSVVYMKACYLESEDAAERLDTMKAELMNQLDQNKAA